MKKILISTLGESPSVVTEALDILKKEGKKIDKIILLTTIDASTQDSAGLLINHISKQYGIIPEIISISKYYDIDTQEALFEFMIKACGVLRENLKSGHEVFVSIAGGRKTMSALMTLAVQIYGAKELFHVIMDDPDLELKSNVNFLRNLHEKEQNELLHPSLDKIKIVKLPFIGLFPWINDIIMALQGTTSGNREIKELLISNKLLQNDQLTQLGKSFLKILNYVQSRPDPCPYEVKINLERTHHYLKEREELASKLAKRFPFICEIKDIGWKEGEPKIKEEPPDKLKIYYRGKRDFTLGLLVKTTAKSEGQLRIAEKEIKEFMDQK